MQKLIFTLFLLLAYSPLKTVHAEQYTTLKQTILALDKQFFDAFNTCDIQTMFALFDQNLEFYHDKTGLTNYQDNLKSTSRLCERKLGLTRTLLPQYNAIFPAGNFGAIQQGRHEFCHIENGKNDCGTFKFLHIWKKSGERWTLSRVVSYDH